MLGSSPVEEPRHSETKSVKKKGVSPIVQVARVSTAVLLYHYVRRHYISGCLGACGTEVLLAQSHEPIVQYCSY